RRARAPRPRAPVRAERPRAVHPRRGRPRLQRDPRARTPDREPLAEEAPHPRRCGEAARRRLGPPALDSAEVGEWFDELAEFLRIPSVSADPERQSDVEQAAVWVADFVRGAGGDAEVVDWEGHPLTIGEIRASHGDGPTVMLYGHFDVQPPDPLELW